MDLIDKKALVEYFEEQCNIASKSADKKDLYVLAAMRCTQDLIEQFPTANAELVRHGRWITVKSPWSGHVQKCSCCKETIKSLSGQLRFCPNCGARMNQDLTSLIKLRDGEYHGKDTSSRNSTQQEGKNWSSNRFA